MYNSYFFLNWRLFKNTLVLVTFQQPIAYNNIMCAFCKHLKSNSDKIDLLQVCVLIIPVNLLFSIYLMQTYVKLLLFFAMFDMSLPQNCLLIYLFLYSL